MLFKPWLEEHYFYMTGLASFPTYSIGFFLLLPDTKTKQHGLNPNATPHGPTGLS